MQTHSLHQVVGHALQTIMDKGANHLYQAYIKTKLPNHSHQLNQHLITHNLNIAYHNQPTPTIINPQQKPIKAPVDSIAPQKLIHRRAQSQLNFRSIHTKLIRMKKSFKSTKCLSSNKNNQSDGKQNVFIRYDFNNVKEFEKKEENKLRREKIKSDKKQREVNEQKGIRQEKEEQKKNNQERKKKGLIFEGSPAYYYDDEGKIFRAHKDQLKNRNKEKLKFKTADVHTVSFHSEKTQSLKGTKKGFSSTKFYKKLKITDQEFNNQHNRQLSLIPYATISEGIKITEKEKNIIASKTKEPIPTRDQFLKQTQTKFFKSFMPDFDGTLSLGTLTQRPMTTGQLNRTKQTAETGTCRSFRKSILWRPQSTIKSCRMNINNRDLARQFVKS